MTPFADLLKALAGLISAVAWPAIAVLTLVWFRDPIARLIDRIIKFKFAGVEAEAEAHVQEQIAKSAAEVTEGKSGAPTSGELARAERVEELARAVPASFVRHEAERLAAEYERVRASMPSGDAKTRAMEVVVAKMRTIGRAAYSLRHEFVASASPGKRLHAIAILQVEPDYDLLDWLAERPAREKPFVAYHALVALDAAAANARAVVYADVLVGAVEKARQSIAGLREDSDRNLVFSNFSARVAQLRAV